MARARPTIPGGDWGDLPAYIDRGHDEKLRRRLQAAAVTGGFLVLVGDSSVGKTRSLYEAVRALLPNWRLLLPDSTVVNVAARTARVEVERQHPPRARGGIVDRHRARLAWRLSGKAAGVAGRVSTAAVVRDPDMRSSGDRGRDRPPRGHREVGARY